MKMNVKWDVMMSHCREQKQYKQTITKDRLCDERISGKWIL